MKYDVGRNRKKPWRYIFWYLLNSCIVNAFILYKEYSTRNVRKKRFAHLDFRIELVKELIGGFCKRKHFAIRETDQNALVSIENLNGHLSIRMAGVKKRCKYHSRVLNTRRMCTDVQFVMFTCARMDAMDSTTCKRKKEVGKSSKTFNFGLVDFKKKREKMHTLLFLRTF